MMIVIYSLSSLVMMAMVSASVELVSNLHKRLEFTNSENMKLLNGMHEGLLIITR